MTCRSNGALECKNAIIEISYDSGTNEINTDVMNKFMMATETLFINYSDKELLSHSPQINPFCKKRSTGEFKSIFDCKLLNFAFEDEIKSIKLVYLIYLYIIKIYHLTCCDIDSMEKVKKLYNYMINEIGCFLAHEFILGHMIFIGTEKEKRIAEGILKFEKIKNGESEVRIIINGLFDIMSYRQMTMIVDLAIKNKYNWNCIFVTQDKNLQNYIELNSDFKSVINEDKITNTFKNEFNTDKRYREGWNNFYENTIFKNSRQRFFEYQLGKKSDIEMEKIIAEISYYENLIFIS